MVSRAAAGPAACVGSACMSSARHTHLGHSGRSLMVGIEQQLHHIDWRAGGGGVVQGHPFVLRERGMQRSTLVWHTRGKRTTKGIDGQCATFTELCAPCPLR